MRKSKQWGLGVGLIASALGVTGCSVAVGEPSACVGAECSVDSTASPVLIGGWATGPWTWSSNQRTRPLPPVASNVCVLTRVSGKFAGTGEAVQLTDDGTNWLLQGFSHQSGVSAEAYCFPRDKFVGGGTRVSSEYALDVFTLNQCSGVFEESLYAADAFSFLTGLQGRMQGSGEWEHVQQALSPDIPSALQGHICSSGTILNSEFEEFTAFARSFRVGAHTSRLALFSNRDGVPSDANTRPEYVAGGNVSSDVAVLAPTSDAMCGLTSIQGAFAGDDESVQIRHEFVRGAEHWVLRTTKGAGSNFVLAGARCYSRTQG